MPRSARATGSPESSRNGTLLTGDFWTGPLQLSFWEYTYTHHIHCDKDNITLISNKNILH